MDIGLGLPQAGCFADLDALRTVALHAEAAGFASLWVFDRLLVPVNPRTPYPASADGILPPEQSRVLDPLVALTTAAAITTTIRVGTNVLIAPLYSPLLLARSAASLDHLSNGRFTLGLGLGWSADEFEAIGRSMRGRNDRIEEMLDVMASAWRDPIVSAKTSAERVAPSIIGLKPTNGTAVPVLLAAYTPAGLERVARRANGWIPTGIPSAAVGPMWSSLLASAERHGRNPETLRLVIRANVAITTTLGSDRAEFAGSMEQIRADVRRIADIGAHELILDLQGTTSSTDELLDVAQDLLAASSTRN